MKGEVIGINSQIYTRSGGYQGISFAIPIDIALNVKDRLVRHGSVTRGQLGVTIQDVNQGLADSFGLKQPGGALVSAVTKGSPAAAAGIQAGDVIVGYNGHKIVDSTELPSLVASTDPGSAADLEVVRKGDDRHLSVKVGRLDNAKVASADSAGTEHGRLGLTVRPLTPEERSEEGAPGGVVVDSATGPAANAGIETGDVILSINNTPVTSVRQLKGLVAKSGRHVALLVQRQNTRIFVPVDLG